MSTVLVIPDLHAPAVHPAAFDFVLEVAEAYAPIDRVVFLGHAYDLHAMSYHAKEAGMPTALDEVEQAREQLQPFYDHFSTGRVDYMIGNHDWLIMRKAVDANIPENWIKPIKSIFGFPKNWRIHPRFGRVLIDGVQYRHGEGLGGATPALAQAKASMRSTVIGHFHASLSVNYYASEDVRLFGLSAGSLCDSSSLAMKYGVKYAKRPLLGMGVVVDGVHAYAEVMPLKNRGVK